MTKKYLVEQINKYINYPEYCNYLIKIFELRMKNDKK